MLLGPVGSWRSFCRLSFAAFSTDGGSALNMAFTTLQKKQITMALSKYVAPVHVCTCSMEICIYRSSRQTQNHLSCFSTLSGCKSP